jgi:hypothetical protein
MRITHFDLSLLANAAPILNAQIRSIRSHNPLTGFRLCAAKLIQRWARVVSPFWVAPLFLGLAVLLGLLTQVVERGQLEPDFEISSWPTPISFVLVGIYVAAWLLETSGLRWPRLLFALLAIAPAFGLLFYGRDTIAPFLPMLVVG